MRYIVWIIGLVILVLIGNWIYQSMWQTPLNTTVQVYFNENRPTEIVQVAVDRLVPGDTSEVALAESAMRELLGGPNDEEQVRGLSSAIQDGSRLNYVRAEGPTVIVDFNEAFDFQVGGAALVLAIRGQVEKTLLQFASFDEVKITINRGAREAILEP